MYRQLKIDNYDSCGSQAQYKMRHHVNMQFNKIPTTSYANATKIWGIRGILGSKMGPLRKIIK